MTRWIGFERQSTECDPGAGVVILGLCLMVIAWRTVFYIDLKGHYGE